MAALAYRVDALASLLESLPEDFATCREIEAVCRARSATLETYHDHVLRCAYNLKQNPSMGRRVTCETDEALAVGTLVGRIHEERRHRTRRFHDMLQQKFEALNDRSFQAVVRCRRCGSEEVSIVEKQTRSADEAASVFCVCIQCKNRWVIR